MADWKTNVDLIQKLYIAFYGRPADPGGLRYWASQLPDNAQADSVAVRDLINRFINSQEAQDRFGSPAFDSVVARIYTFAYGRDITDSEKEAFRGKSIADVLIQVIGVGYGPDYAALNNKLQYAKWFVEILDPNGNGIPDDAPSGKFMATYSGNTDAEKAKSLLMGITAANPPASKEVVLRDITDPNRGIADSGDQLIVNPPVTGETFLLTVNQDTLFGKAGNDTFIAGSAQDGAGHLINTLQTVDSVDGGDGTDTLIVTLTDVTGTSAEDRVAPTLTSIENVIVRFADTSNVDTLDLSLSTGVRSVTVQNSANQGKVVGLGSVASLTVQNQNEDVIFDNSTATTLSLVAVNVGSTRQISIDLGETTASKAKVVNLTLNSASVEVKDSAGGGVDVIESLTIAATGKNKVKLSNGDNSLTALTVTGSGSVDLSQVTLAKLKTLDATANEGGVTVTADKTPTSILTGKGADTITVGDLSKSATIKTGDGPDKITVGALAAGETFVIDSGAGNDTIDLTGATKAAILNVTGGDGDDVIKLGSNLTKFDAKSTIDGGAGVNTVGIADGDTLTSAYAKLLSNFQVLDITGGKGKYDVSLLPGANTVNAAGKDFADAVTVKNVLASTVINISSAEATDLNVSKILTLTPKDASGVSDVITVNLKAVDGDDDRNVEGQITLANLQLTKDAAGKGVEVLRITSDAIPDQGKKVTDYTNTVEVVAGTSDTTTLEVKVDAGLVIGTVDSSLSNLSFIKVSGAGNFVITNLGPTGLTKVDASGASGAVTIDASSNTKSVSYVGSSGVDTYKAGTAGDIIYTGKGADVVRLDNKAGGAGAVRDTFVLKAATDSQISDTNNDGKVTLAVDGGYDVVSKFDPVGNGPNTSDRLDLTNFNFTGAQRGVVDVSGLVTGTTDLKSIPDLFSSPAGYRGVAYSVIGGDSYVFIDANKDGNFTAADDIVIKLVGVTSVWDSMISF